MEGITTPTLYPQHHLHYFPSTANYSKEKKKKVGDMYVSGSETLRHIQQNVTYSCKFTGSHWVWRAVITLVCACLCVHYPSAHLMTLKDTVFVRVQSSWRKSGATRAFCFWAGQKSAEMGCIDRQRGESKQSPWIKLLKVLGKGD